MTTTKQPGAATNARTSTAARTASAGTAGTRRLHGRGLRRAVTLWLLLLVPVLLLPGAPAHGEDVLTGQGAARWVWPVETPHAVVRPFEAPDHRYGPGHRGIDVTGPAPTVRAVEDGTVRFSGMVAGRPVLSILHEDGLVSTYEPVTASVTAGDVVVSGQVVGELWSGASHCVQAPCLHLGARRGEDYLDPLLLLGEHGPSVLLPLEDHARGGATARGAARSTQGLQSPVPSGLAVPHGGSAIPIGTCPPRSACAQLR